MSNSSYIEKAKAGASKTMLKERWLCERPAQTLADGTTAEWRFS